MRACTHGDWAHRQRVGTTFLTRKNSRMFLLLLTGFEPSSFGSWVRRATNWATPSPHDNDMTSICPIDEHDMTSSTSFSDNVLEDDFIQDVSISIFYVSSQPKGLLKPVKTKTKQNTQLHNLDNEQQHNGPWQNTFLERTRKGHRQSRPTL